MKNLFVMLPLFAGYTTIPFFADAQYYYNGRFFQTNLSYQAGASFGAMNCMTDLGGQNHKFLFLKDVNWINSKPSATIFIKTLYYNAVGLRLEVCMGTLTAYDSILKKNRSRNWGRLQRNLSFKTTITEAALLTEIHPFQLTDNNYAAKLSPYIIFGIGFFYFNPKAKWENRWVRLQPLHTEGQGFQDYPERKNYSLTQWNLPLGVGFHYPVSDVFMMSIEWIYRKLFTDYLDDVSSTYVDPATFLSNLPEPIARLATQLANRQKENNGWNSKGNKRGNPSNKDAYFSFNIKVALKLGKDNSLKP